MKFIIPLCYILLTALCACHEPPKPQNPPYQLWYNKPAQQWTDALPIGNGRLGAMVYGGVVNDHIQFNEETLWTGEPREYQRDGAYRYLPQIRRLLAAGRQADAEKLAEEHFMGTKSHEDTYEKSMADWIVEVTAAPEFSPAVANFVDSTWKEIELPTPNGWEDKYLQNLDGAVWFRKTVNLPDSLEEGDMKLKLGKISNYDYTYFNGTLVGSTEDNDKQRQYDIPSEVLQPGQNQIAVQVLNFKDKGGFRGFEEDSTFMTLYSEKEKGDTINLNGNWKYWIQNNIPPVYPKYEETYQPFGDLWLRFKNQGKASNYRRSLDITRAISEVSYEADGVTYNREYLVSEPDQVMAINLKASKNGKLTFDANMKSPHLRATTRKINNTTLGLTVAVRGGFLKGTGYLTIITKGGEVSVTKDKILVKEANEATLYLAASTNFLTYRDVSGNPDLTSRQTLEGIGSKSYSQIRTDHMANYRKYYSTFAINLGLNKNDSLPTDVRLNQFNETPDPALVALYLQYGRYLLISSSRPGTQPANLQGIWNDQLNPPWDSKYTTNINAEMNYWPAEVLNLSACHEPLFQMIEDLAETGKATAQEHYNASGWVLHHNTDLWRGTAPINASNHGIWVTGGAWMCQHLWEHFQFTQDTTFLEEEAYPVMKEAAEFFVDFLVKDPRTGWLISTPSNSPENGGLVAGPTMDHQIIRALFQHCIQASEILDIDEDFRAVLEEKYKQIAPNQIGKHGQLQEWLRDLDDPENHHRHVSHLWGVYPGNEISWADSAMMEAARQSLEYRGDEGTGWSLAWKINFWARFKDGNHAFNMIKMLLSPAEAPNRETRGGSYKNLFDAHPPFQIDGNFGGAAGIAELLLQSHTDTLDILPALPDNLPNGEIRGICARGGFVLNLSWSNGKLEQVEVFSKVGAPCRIRYADKISEFETEKGETYLLNENLRLH